MAWSLEVSPEFERDYQTRPKKNAAMRRAVDKKIRQILDDPLRFKPLGKPLARQHPASARTTAYGPGARAVRPRALAKGLHGGQTGRWSGGLRVGGPIWT